MLNHVPINEAHLLLEKQAIGIIDEPQYVDSIKYTLKEALAAHDYSLLSTVITKLNKCMTSAV